MNESVCEGRRGVNERVHTKGMNGEREYEDECLHIPPTQPTLLPSPMAVIVSLNEFTERWEGRENGARRGRMKQGREGEGRKERGPMWEGRKRAGKEGEEKVMKERGGRWEKKDEKDGK